MIILGVIFGFIFPWEDMSGDRSWSQKAHGRTIVQIIRIFLEFIVIFYVIFSIKYRRITLEFIIKAFAISAILSFWIGLFDYFISYQIKATLFDLEYFEKNRFLGLNGEPKALGRSSAFAYSIILLFCIQFKKYTKFYLFSIFTCILGVLLSSSASSYILFLLLNVLIFLKFNFKSILSFILIAFLLITSYFILLENNLLHPGTHRKITKALIALDEDWIKNEPKLFKRFDIFDRLALIYLWNNPIYLVTGTGPNLISLPMSKYIPSNTIFHVWGRVDSVPNVFPINITARSGLIGLTLYFLFIYNIIKLSFKNLPLNISKIYLSSLLFNFVFINITFILFSAIFIGLHSRK
ncbi:O-antigen ligase family protein [Thermaurantimonas aggregans]|uniref:O-antigen ligase family protein n=1 Tax=Thermaurantimonas aggregans TaxID=2173829 RepID=UPI000F56BCCC|nr:O-antigen ligase family protein [Thermaurantimonas aggregans]